MTTLKSIKNKYLQASDGSSLGVDQNKDNVSLLAFKMAAADSIAKFDMRDGMFDTFTDATGVDASASTNENRGPTNYFSGGTEPNYYGDSSLGNCTFGTGGVTQSGNTTGIDSVLATGSAAGGGGSSSYGDQVPNSSECYEFTVLNKSGSYDGDMVVANFKDLTIDSGVTLTTDQPCRGMFIYVNGNCTINGALSMTARGGASDPTASGGSDSSAVGTNGLQYGVVTSGGSDTFTNDGSGFAGVGTAVKTAIANQDNLSSNGTILAISKEGAARQTKTSNNYPTHGNNGTSGAATISTGGGGVSGCAPAAGTVFGGKGGAFSGGSGSAGSWGGSNASGGPDNGVSVDHGADYGGHGGVAADKHHGGYTGYCGGGAGNPGGDNDRNQSNGQSWPAPNPGGNDGVGGIIWLIVGGNLTIGSGATIQTNGTNGHEANSNFAGSGSGGGAIHAAYTGTLTNNGAIQANGGTHGDQAQSSGDYGEGADGGNGGTQTTQISGTSFNDLTLVSNAVTALAQPTAADVVLTYTNGAGTATINTDLKVFVSRDNGTTYTEGTLVQEGTVDSDTILACRRLDISGQPAGTSMRYKVTTHNQSASKETRVMAASLAWA